MYGPTTKSIRMNKGLSLKNVYTGVCSKTNAIKFEKGERAISAEKFYQVLQNLMITMTEFQWIKQEYRPEMKEQLRHLISDSWNLAQGDYFEQLVEHSKAASAGIERVQLASYLLLANFRKGGAPLEKELQVLVAYFSELQTWTASDLKFFANNCYILPYELLRTLLNEALKVKERYHMYPDSEQIFATLYANAISRMLLEKDVQATRHYLTLLDDVAQGIAMNGYRLLYKCYTAKSCFLFENQVDGRKQLQEVLAIAHFFQNQQIIDEIEELLA